MPQHPAPLLPAGLPCDFEHSLCRGRNEMCIGRGPAFPDYFKSNEIIANRQAAKAQELLLAASEELTGAYLLAFLCLFCTSSTLCMAAVHAEALMLGCLW